VYSFLDWSVGPSAIIWYVAISIFIILCFFFQLMVHKLRDWAAKRFAKKYRQETSFQNAAAAKAMTESPASVHQNSNFEPLASTIGGGSRITFGESSAEHISNASSIYYY
jgi:hypothetical protein